MEKKSKKKLIIFIIIGLIIFIVGWGILTKLGVIDNFLNIGFLCSEDEDSYDEMYESKESWKPVIYLYSLEEQQVEVKLELDGKLIADYPPYDYKTKGWEVTAYPDGTLINKADNKEYSYLFWEGTFNNNIKYDFSEGSVVKGEDTLEFLQTKLAEIGLTPKEYNEFIVYWYPLMKDNKYNLIKFAASEYTDQAKLTIEPKPDSILRVFMVYKAIKSPINVKPQNFSGFERRGFTVVEWGGSEIK